MLLKQGLPLSPLEEDSTVEIKIDSVVELRGKEEADDKPENIQADSSSQNIGHSKGEIQRKIRESKV